VRRSVLMVLVMMLAATACRATENRSQAPLPAPTEAPVATRDGGTVTVAAEQFPTDLNAKLNPSPGTARTAGVALARGYLITPDLQMRPWLFDGDCTVTAPAPYTVSCRIVPHARWSDGTDLTAEDFRFTWATMNDPRHLVVSREGFNKISDLVVRGPKQFDMVFTVPYPSFRTIWSTAAGATLPKHVLEQADFNTVWRSCICAAPDRPIGSGPYVVESFTAGSGPLVLSRNDAYWGPRPKLDKVVFRPFPSVDSQVQALREGQVDVIFPTTETPGLRTLIEGAPGIAYDSALGVSWEHLDMLTDVPGLDDVEVRRAIATALPRRQVVERLAKPVDPRAEVLQNVIYMANQRHYVKHWDIYPESGDPAAARQILERNGYRRGEDGVYARSGVRLAFTIGVNAANEPRKLAQQIIQQRLEEAGIRLEIQNPENAVTVAQGSQWNMVIFAWTGVPDPAGASFWREDGIPPAGQNVTRVRNAALTELIRRADSELDEIRRAELYNQADEILARDVISSVPLYQRPQPLAHKDTLTGLRSNPTLDSLTWNLGDWAFRA